MIKRIQFPQAPSGTINATQRMQLGVGMIELAVPANTLLLKSGTHTIVRSSPGQTIIRKK